MNLRRRLEAQRGRIYRDLDGTLVNLLDVKNELCRWVPLNSKGQVIQVTHRENFRRRFRPLAAEDTEQEAACSPRFLP